eukprot:3864180-Lingulodinium_polyedra.AAC.1
MADDERSESPPNFWPELLESANRPKGSKAVPSKTPVPKVIGKVASSSATTPGGKGAHSRWLVPTLYEVGPPVYPKPAA